MNNANENKQINQTEIKDARTVFKIMKKMYRLNCYSRHYKFARYIQKRNVWRKVSHATAEIKHTNKFTRKRMTCLSIIISVTITHLPRTTLEQNQIRLTKKSSLNWHQWISDRWDRLCRFFLRWLKRISSPIFIVGWFKPQTYSLLNRYPRFSIVRKLKPKYGCQKRNFIIHQTEY